MRFIGNKSKLLPYIQDLLDRHGLRGGTLIDIFSGTSAVGRHFKKLGFKVIANDHLPACYTQAVAGIEVNRFPAFERLRHACRTEIESPAFRKTFAKEREPHFLPDCDASPPNVDNPLPLQQMIHLLDHFIPPREGLIFRNYCPGGPGKRMYFRDDHGRKIDGVLEFLRECRRSRVLEHGELHLLLAALIDAADRVANISGVYGAFLKAWQTNTRGELTIRVPEVVESPHRNEAHQADANALIRRVSGDVLYIDPPYNHRQYAANYHILEILAEHHRIADLAAYEAALYGKTGLRPYQDLRSAYCVRPRKRRGSVDVLSAMSDLILNAQVQHVVVSYSEEGILSREQIGDILARFSRAKSFDFDRNFVEIDYPRFRSDADRAPVDGQGGRTYQVVEGKERDRIGELLFFATRGDQSDASPDCRTGWDRSGLEA